VSIERPGQDASAALLLGLPRCALATSGDTRRHLLRDAVRYSHIMDVRTRRAVPGGPASVTVAAGTCVEAGMLATFAMLRGAQTEAFLEEQGVRHRSLRLCGAGRRGRAAPPLGWLQCFPPPGAQTTGLLLHSTPACAPSCDSNKLAP
jgi:hypothetical protein